MASFNYSSSSSCVTHKRLIIEVTSILNFVFVVTQLFLVKFYYIYMNAQIIHYLVLFLSLIKWYSVFSLLGLAFLTRHYISKIHCCILCQFGNIAEFIHSPWRMLGGLWVFAVRAVSWHTVAIYPLPFLLLHHFPETSF